MRRRTLTTALLCLLLIALCLALGGLSCTSTREQEDPCKQVVGNSFSAVRVYLCRLEDKCYYIAGTGGILETPCIQHPIAEEDK